MAACPTRFSVIFHLAFILLVVCPPSYGMPPVARKQNNIDSICASSRSLAFARRCPILAQSYYLASSFLNLRGGTFLDGGHLDDSSMLSERSACDTKNKITFKMAGFESEESTEPSIYASIGFLTFSPIHHHKSPNECEAKILICHRSSGGICNEYWGLYNAQSKLPGNSHCNYLAAATTIGCLCHAIVLSLPNEKFSDYDMQRMDDALFCLAQGLVRRLRSVEAFTQKVMVPVTLVFVDKTEYERCEILRKYIERYLHLALSRVLEQKEKSNAQTDDLSHGFGIKVNISFGSAAKIETDLSEKILKQLENSKSVASEAIKNEEGYIGVYEHNLVPRSSFGVLLSNTQKDICKAFSFMQNYGTVSPIEWTKISVKMPISITAGLTTMKKNQSIGRSNDIISSKNMQSTSSTEVLSPGFQEKVESLMAVSFVDAEESLNEIETRMDDAFFNLNEPDLKDIEMPELGTDFDAVLNKISESFFKLVDGDPSLTDSDHRWANAQRLVTLEQITSTSIHRVFQLYLQNLRDYCGRIYEGALDNFSAARFGTYERYRRDAARRAEERFTKSAFDSKPQICRHPDGELSEQMSALYSCVDTLTGLLEDMYEATSSRVLEQEEWEDIVGNRIEDTLLNQGGTSLFKERIGLRKLIKKIRDEWRERGPARWYERLAFRVLIIGVNYFQGWIMLHSLRQEARKRDLSMPKFPLF